jgi:hypothetical protein
MEDLSPGRTGPQPVSTLTVLTPTSQVGGPPDDLATAVPRGDNSAAMTGPGAVASASFPAELDNPIGSPVPDPWTRPGPDGVGPWRQARGVTPAGGNQPRDSGGRWTQV